MPAAFLLPQSSCQNHLNREIKEYKQKIYKYLIYIIITYIFLFVNPLAIFWLLKRFSHAFTATLILKLAESRSENAFRKHFYFAPRYLCKRNAEKQ